MTTNTCKGCTRNVIIKREEIEHILTKHKGDEQLIVSNDVYHLRLDTCKACSSLMYGTTCSYSGCLVEYRAKFINKKCPSPNGSKW
ncbi:hypothetical protein CHH83_22830 [Bacillus sp. 7586-K]|nr:hypothetical protein CHH83_22830 [Bacillus sp. 7586-K]